MKYLLDTNVVSELRKRNCDPNVRAFIKKVPNEHIFISVVSIGEIIYGIHKLDDENKKAELELWFDNDLPMWFDDRVIALDWQILGEWGALNAKSARTLPVMDTLIAASAITRRLTIATRNTKDFASLDGVSVFNPWGTFRPQETEG
jgi:predicted nucleic acid-binding protein